MGLFRKSGGGFLNGVAGTLQGITFEAKTWGEGEKAYRQLSAELSILADGATEPVSQFLGAGFIYDGEEVSEDGHTLEGGEREIVGDNSEFAAFVKSAIEAGFPTEDLEAARGRNFDALAGYRYTFAKVPNRDRQMAAGRKKLGIKAGSLTGKAGKTYTEEEVMQAGRRQDKNDKTKFYNHDMLTVSAVLGQAEAAPKGAKKATAPKTAVAAKGGKPNGAAKVAADYDAADAFLIELLADAKDNVIKKGSIGSVVVRKALADDLDDATRDAYRALLSSDTYLAREAGWKFNAEDKSQPISLA